jgi:hypothetical protein
VEISILNQHTARPNEVPFARIGVRYGVFDVKGHLLADWDTREQAGRFIHPGTERYVAEVVNGVEVGKGRPASR